jgi:putative transposase
MQTGVDQLWRADITYVRLRDEFVFLAVILDAFSRRVIGWALDHHMEDELTLAALRMALSHRSIQPGLVHHSDRGSQYASNDCTGLLKANGIDISMSRKGNPWDNAACESFMKTLKHEEVLRSEYRDMAEARASISEFLEKVYNQKRLHSALGYLPPAKFEAQLAARNFAKPLEKGQLISVDGQIRYREYAKEVNGTTIKHRVAQIHASKIQRLTKGGAPADPSDDQASDE